MGVPARTLSGLRRRSASLASQPMGGLDPLQVHEMVHTPTAMPDPIEFVISDKYLNRGNLYPRQATMLKVFFLRDDMLTQYDHDVIGEWEESFLRTGNEGISPKILERIRLNKERGRPWFREVLTVIGRRGGKGHIGGLTGAYVLWNYMHKPGGPQSYYGIDRDKRLTCIVFAGKKEQAVANQWRDLYNVIMGGPCFGPYISRPQSERLTVYAPADMLRIQKQMMSGIATESDQASFEIVPSPSTMMAGRGPTSFMQFYDEMAHVVNSGANRSAEEVYTAASPSLDQFGVDAFLYEGSSPWQMQGQFYDNWTRAIELDDSGAPSYPEMVMVQLPSWGTYEDWEDAHRIPIRPPSKTHIEVLVEVPRGKTESGQTIVERVPRIIERVVPAPTLQPLKKAVQTYDDQMRQLEKANPETFAVERRSHWAQSLASYLDRKKIEEMFGPWRGQQLRMQTRAPLSMTLKAHGDPSKVNDNFGWAIAHTEAGDESTRGLPYVVFDVLHHWRPGDFPNHTIDYLAVLDDIKAYIKDFAPDEITFDQFNSVMPIGLLQQYVIEERIPKRISIFEKTATRPLNWKRAEIFKAALNLGLIKAPMLDVHGEVSEHAEMAELELRFLEEANGKVDHPSSGPIQHNDIADAMFECVYALIGEQMAAFLGQAFDNAGVSGTAAGGADPYRGMNPPGSNGDTSAGLAALTAGAARQRGMGQGPAARGGMRRR